MRLLVMEVRELTGYMSACLDPWLQKQQGRGLLSPAFRDKAEVCVQPVSHFVLQ